MEKKDYKPRLIDKIIDEYLQSFGAVCIEGPKWCGKTWTSSYHANARLTGEVNLRKIIDLIIRGGWPANQSTSLKQAAYLPMQYIRAILDDDVYRVDEVKRDKHKMELLLRSLARNEATTATNKKLKNDIKEVDDEDIDVESVAVYLDTFDAKIYHYQDYNNNEIDAVIEMQSGEWCAFEIRLGANQIDAAAENLIKVSDDIGKNGGRKPSVLCVICGLSNAAYQRPDGVFVVPVTALRD